MANLFGKEETKMKKYTAPDMKVMAFMAEEEMSAALSRSGDNATVVGGGSNLYNDAEFGAW